MGRPKGVKDSKPRKRRGNKTRSDAPGAEALASIGHNSGVEELSEDQLQSLFFQHKKTYEHRLAAKKKADADFKNACKEAKSELGKDAVSKIKIAIKLDTEEGEAEVRNQIASAIQVARWMGAEVGTQFDMFDGDTPMVDRAYEDGKRASIQNHPRQPPHAPGTPGYDSWMQGYNDHQEELSARFKKTESSSLQDVIDEGDRHIRDNSQQQ